jgi:hypothetical protein
LVEGQGLERGQDRPDIAKLRPVERSQPESPACLRRQQALAGEAEQGLADRGPANPELAGYGGVANAGAMRD